MTVYRFRTWRCEDCKTCFRSMEDDPTCPTCAKEAEPQMAVSKQSSLPAPAMLSERTKNVDGIARSLMAEHGMTDMRDNQKQGDIAAPPLTASQRALLNPTPTGGFWQGGAPSAAASSMIADGHAGVPKDHAMRTLQNMIKSNGH